MPLAPLRPCNKPGCKELVKKGYCLQHHKSMRKQRDELELSARQRGYTGQWEKSRLAYLNQHPLCVRCQEQGIIKAADVVDHIKPHKGNKAAFWNQDNWQSLCSHHHNLKTATEDGGFGRGIA